MCRSHPGTAPRRLYQICILSTLLYSSECRRMTESNLSKLTTFHTKNLRRILQMFWPKTISNQHILTHCNQDSMTTRCHHVKAMDMDRQHLSHSPSLDTRGEAETRATQEHLVSNCRRGVQDPPSHLVKILHHTWRAIQRLAQNRHGTLCAALHANWHNEHE